MSWSNQLTRPKKAVAGLSPDKDDAPQMARDVRLPMIRIAVKDKTIGTWQQILEHACKATRLSAWTNYRVKTTPREALSRAEDSGIDRRVAAPAAGPKRATGPGITVGPHET
jgi:hypothetical protein